MPPARLNVISTSLWKWRIRGLTAFYRMKSSLRALCSNKRLTVFPASLYVSHPHIHSLWELPYFRSYPVSSGTFARSIRCFYSVFITPISAPQCLHFIIKSGYRSIDEVMNCAFVPSTASMIRHPHCGHRTGRIFAFISSVVSSFFLRILIYAPSCFCRCPAWGNHKGLLYGMFHLTSSESHAAVGFASRRAFR